MESGVGQQWESAQHAPKLCQGRRPARRWRWAFVALIVLANCLIVHAQDETETRRTVESLCQAKTAEETLAQRGKLLILGAQSLSALYDKLRTCDDMATKLRVLDAIIEVQRKSVSTDLLVEYYLEQGTRDPGDESVFERRWEATKALAAIGLPVIPILLKYINHSDHLEELIAMRALTRMDAIEAEDAVLRFLAESKRLSVTWEAAWYLAGEGRKEAVPILSERLCALENGFHRAQLAAGLSTLGALSGLDIVVEVMCASEISTETTVVGPAHSLSFDAELVRQRLFHLLPQCRVLLEEIGKPETHQRAVAAFGKWYDANRGKLEWNRSCKCFLLPTDETGK